MLKGYRMYLTLLKCFYFFSSTNLDNVSPSDKCTICDKTQNPEENCVDSFVPENRDGTEV